MPFDPASAASIADAIAKAADQIGEVRAVVDIANPGLAASPKALSDVDEAGWDERVTGPLAYALHRLQGSYRSLRTAGGRVVVVLPTLSMSGAAGMVPWTTVSEGQRALAKVAARAWGAEGITVNCLGVPAHLLAPQQRRRPYRSTVPACRTLRSAGFRSPDPMWHGRSPGCSATDCRSSPAPPSPSTAASG